MAERPACITARGPSALRAGSGTAPDAPAGVVCVGVMWEEGSGDGAVSRASPPVARSEGDDTEGGTGAPEDMFVVPSPAAATAAASPSTTTPGEVGVGEGERNDVGWGEEVRSREMGSSAALGGVEGDTAALPSPHSKKSAKKFAATGAAIGHTGMSSTTVSTTAEATQAKLWYAHLVTSEVPAAYTMTESLD